MILKLIKIHHLGRNLFGWKRVQRGIFEDSIDGTLRAMPIEIIVKQNKDGHCILDFDVKKMMKRV